MENGESILNILLIDDNAIVLHSLEAMLGKEDGHLDSFENPLAALDYVRENPFSVDMVICDLKMPEMDGITFFRRVCQINPAIRRILMSAYQDFLPLVTAFNEGVIHSFVLKPFTADSLRSVLEKNRQEVLPDRSRNDRGRKLLNNSADLDLPPLHSFHGILTSDPQMLKKFEFVTALAKTQTPVFIYGETGTGKERMARAVHLESPRSAKPFLAVNCATFSAGLLESQLFGHKKGAFTGANSNQIGLFQAAEGGTLFLDEVTDIDPGLQAKLLRTLQEKEYTPIGEVVPVKFDIQIVSASSITLDEAIAQGRFRPELKYRLEVIPLVLPPLRERQMDIVPLFMHFIEQAMAKYNARLSYLDKELIEALQRYRWPGNIRELQNLASYLLALSDHEDVVLTKNLLPLNILNPPETPSRRKSDRVSMAPDAPRAEESEITQQRPELNRELIDSLMQKFQGNRSAVARHLGVSRMTLWRHLKNQEEN